MGDGQTGLSAGRWVHQQLVRPDGAVLRLSRWQADTGVPARAATILLLPGRAESVEKYADLATILAANRLGVVAMDWRGQGGSSRPLPNRLMGHVDNFSQYLDDLAASLPVLLADAGTAPVAALGHSMGGHILLRFVVERPHPFRAIVACAPMMGICSSPLPEWAARGLSSLAVRLGCAHRFAPGQANWVANPRPVFERNPLTGDKDRFEANHQIFVDQPQLALGGASWGWLHAALRSIEGFFADERLGSTTLPILVLSGREDKVVRTDRHDLAAAYLPNATLVPVPGGRHELLMESDDIRNPVIFTILRYLSDQGCPPVQMG